MQTTCDPNKLKMARQVFCENCNHLVNSDLGAEVDKTLKGKWVRCLLILISTHSVGNCLSISQQVVCSQLVQAIGYNTPGLKDGE